MTLHLLRARARRLTTPAGLAILAASFAAPHAAEAAPLTYTGPGGATVTFNTDKLVAGAPGTQRVTFTGSGFVGTNPGDGRGLPVFAVKFDDDDVFTDWGPLGAGGVPNENDADQFKIEEPEVASFPAEPDGDISGWFDVPANVAKDGPGEGDNAGQHWFRVLSGAFSTTGVNLNNDKNVTVPITARAWLSAVDPLTVGFTNAIPTFFPGTIVPAAPGTLTAKGVGFPASTAVTVTLDGGAALTAKNYGTQVDLTSGADGHFNAAVTLTPGAPGPRVLRFVAGGVAKEITLTRVPQAATHVTSQTVRPGGTVVVNATGYVGITGAGQKVGLILQPGDKLLGCAQADATGAATITGKIPANELPVGDTTGTRSLFVAGGASCVTGGPVLEPMPRLTQLTGPTGLTVSSTAPVLSSPFTRVSVGGTLPIAGEGYTAGEVVTVKIDGATAGAPLTASADGRIAGNVTVPAATALGDRVLTLVSNASASPTPTLAVGFKATAAAKVTLGSTTSVQPGQAVSFTLAGFGRGDGTAGQKVGVKVDTGAIVECVQTDLDGNGAGSITIPAGTESGEHTLRFLAGSSCVSGTQNDLPSRSIAAAIQVVVPPAVDLPTPTPSSTPVPTPTPQVTPTTAPNATPTPTTSPTPLGPVAPKPTKVKSTAKGASIEITLATGAGTSIKVGAKTKSKVKLTSKAKAKIVTVVKVKTVKAGRGKAPKLVLKLTADGRKLLKARRTLKIVVTTQLAGGPRATKTFTLKA